MTKLYYQRILAIGAIAIFFTNLYIYLFTAELINVPAYYWVIAFGLAAAPLFLSGGHISIFRESQLVHWCYAFFLITSVWFLAQPSQSSEVVWQDFQNRLWAVLFMLLMLSVFSGEDAQLWARRAILLAVLFAVGLNIYEAFNPLTFSLVMGRSASFYRNPNLCGMALILGMIFSIGILPHSFRLLFVLVVAIGVFLTFSRSAMLGWSVSILVTLMVGEIRLRRSLVVGLACMAIFILLLMPWWDELAYKLDDAGALNTNVVNRMEWFKKPTLSDQSALDRQEVLDIAWDKLGESPILGHGVGAAKKLLMVKGGVEISSHNQYLNLMVDHGILGMFILPLLVLAGVWQARGEARRIGSIFAAYILVLGFFTHNILDARFILMSFSLLSAMVARSRRDQAGIQSTC